ncbi:epimerase [Nonomuraea sp. CA-141351]|uniref:epimerase n=1 Tax=Nonomuraea sp. CA-141351 TaxID=3239996 RepID=UPI003D9402F9
MRVILFGATGMVGRGVLRQCLLDDRVTAVLTVGRAPTGLVHDKLREIRHDDLLDLSAIEGELGGYDACFFCLGVSSAGMSEKDYRRVTYDFTLSAGRTLARLSPGSTFVYVSGAGTDAQGRSMWARVKGATENALLALPLEAYMFRPGYIQPMHGVTSRTRLYRVAYVVTRPLYPMLRLLFPSAVTTTEQIGRAMIAVAERGAPERILGPSGINALAS